MNKLHWEQSVKLFMYLVFAFALVHSLWALSVGFHLPIMDEHNFRQTQTAYSAYWLMRGGPFFRYETPLLGYPWAAPFELPVYQWLCAKLALLSGLPLEESGRLVGRAFFYLSLWPIFSLFRFFRLSSAVCWAGLSIYLLSPLYLYWSRTFLIESSALFFALAYAALFAQALRSKQLSCWLLVAFLGALAGATKVTTAFAFYVFTGCLMIWEWRERIFRAELWRSRNTWLLLIFGFLVPGILTIAWVKFSDAVKMENALGSFATSASLTEWNFGTLAQRLSGKTWYMFFRKTLHDSIGHRSTWIFSLLLLPFFPKRERLLYFFASLFFVLPPMVFTNLHIAHNYYWYANGIFMIAALVMALQGIFVRAQSSRVFAGVFLIFFLTTVVFELRYYHRFQYFWQQNVAGGMEPIGKRVQELTKEDDVIWIGGFAWYPAVAFYTNRRSVMDPTDAGIGDIHVQEAVKNTFKAGYKVSLLLLCRSNKDNHAFWDTANKLVELESENLAPNHSCDMYRIKGLRQI